MGGDEGVRTPLPASVANKLTIESELKARLERRNGQSIGGVHWRTDNSRSLVLGEARVLADITTGCNEHPSFVFRSFRRLPNGQPKVVTILQGRVYVDGVLVDTHSSAL